MQILTKRFAPLKQEDLVEVKLWEIFLRYNGNLYKVLSDWAVDKAPYETETSTDRVVFRFTARTWETSAREFLRENRIPVMVKTRSPREERGERRQPVLR